MFLTSVFVACLQSVLIITISAIQRRMTHPHRYLLKLLALLEHQVGESFSTSVWGDPLTKPIVHNLVDWLAEVLLFRFDQGKRRLLL